MVEIEKVYRVDGFIFENIENAEKFKFFIEKYNYNKMQKDIIYSGLKNKLNVSLYAKHNFTSEQMYQIREGLEKGLDVSIYAKPEYPTEQMSLIREALEKGEDVTDLLDPNKNWIEMFADQFFKNLK